MDMFNEVKTLDWGKGTSPLYGGRKVDVIDVRGNQRQVSWYVPGEPEPTKQWVDVALLREMPGTPIPPKEEPSLAAAAAALAAEDEALADVPAIAQKEIDLAQERDALLLEIESLKSRLQTQTEIAEQVIEQRDEALGVNRVQSDKLKETALRIAQLRNALGAMPDNDDLDYLEHLLMHSMAELRGQIGDLKAQVQPQPAARRKNETKIITLHVGLASTNTELGRYIDKLDSEGWEIAYEEYQQGVGEHGSTYFARLIRPAQDPISPPQDEARTAVTVADINALDSDPAPEVADNSATMLWQSEDEWDDVPNPDEIDIDEDEPELVPEMLIVGLDEEPAWKKVVMNQRHTTKHENQLH